MVFLEKKILKVVSSTKFYFVMFFLVILFIHQFFDFFNDDIFFRNVLDNYTFYEYLKFRYNNWTSRILIESILIILSRNIYLWRFLNSLIVCLLVYSIEKVFINTGKKSNFFLISLLVLLYPFYQMAEAGFAATTINYLWPLTFLIFSFVPLRYIYDSKKVSKKMLFIYLLSFIFACNQEQAVCIGFIVAIISFIYFVKEKKRKFYSLLLLIISCFSLGFIILCPGNNIRSAVEIVNCYPDYINANLLDKIYLGIVSSCSVIISNFLIIWLFSFIILIVVLLKKSEKIIKMLSWVQFIIITLISAYRVYIVLNCNSFIEAYTYGIFGYYTELGNVFNFSIMNFLVLGFCLGMVIIYLILLYSLFNKNFIFVMLILLIGCFSRLMMGFSPTIFASGTRTMIFLYFSLLIIILLLFVKYNNLLSKKVFKFLLVLIFVFIIVNYILTFLALPMIINN